MSKRKFFDPEFADAIMDIRVSILEEENQTRRKTLSFMGCITAIVIGAFAGISVARQEKLETRIVALEQENQRRDCQQEAESMGAGYVFIARGAETECWPLYSD